MLVSLAEMRRDEAPVAPSRWPYQLAIGFLIAGTAGFLYAPFSGVAYVALPGMGVAAWFAFADERRFRLGLAVSFALLAVGFLAGVTGLALIRSGSDFFAAEAPGYPVVALVLWVVPLLGLSIGAVSLAGGRLGRRSSMNLDSE